MFRKLARLLRRIADFLNPPPPPTHPADLPGPLDLITTDELAKEIRARSGVCIVFWGVQKVPTIQNVDVGLHWEMNPYMYQVAQRIFHESIAKVIMPPPPPSSEEPSESSDADVEEVDEGDDDSESQEEGK